jgi:hypothetical protein
MAAELTAVRLLAPHFGDSAYVWTNVIGVILAALAAGALLGGRLAGRSDPRRSLRRLLVGAGLLLVLAPFLSRAIGTWLLPMELPLDAAMPAMVRGSFVATMLLFAPPLLLLGAVSPLLITCLCGTGRAIGGAAGAVSAAGTVGSLVGTFAATHWLVPALGCRLAMTVAGGGLVVASLLLASRGRPGTAGILALLVTTAGLALPRGPLRPAPPGRELLAECESSTQFLQVQREPGSDGRSRRLLVINEGLDSYHSVAVEGSRFTGGAYYDWHAMAPFLAGDGERPNGLRALSIGDAGGSLRAVYAAVHPGAVVDAVDIDAAPMALGDQWFPGPKADGLRCVLDGRVFLGAATARWHVIHVDAYAHQVYVPAHLASREFFATAFARLEPAGVLACNIGALHDQDQVLRAVGTTMATVFGNARALQIPGSRNVLLVARRDASLRPERLAEVATPEELSPADLEIWNRVRAVSSSPSAWRDVSSGGYVLVDDRPQLDQLLAHGYLDLDDRGSVTECAGTMQIAGAEAAAYQAANQRDWLGALRAIEGSSVPSTYLREIGGDARWALRQLGAAEAEYTAALQSSTEAEERQRLERKRTDVRAERQPILAAAARGTQNGWLQAALCGAALLGLWFGGRRFGGPEGSRTA